MKVLSALLLLWFSSSASGQLTTFETIQADATLVTMATALEAGNARAVLASRSFTMFAPTDDAFASGDQASFLAKLLEPAWVSHLRFALSNHLIYEEVVLTAADFTDGLEVNSLLSFGLGVDPLTFSVDSGTGDVFISGLAYSLSMVTEADIACTNGIIHKVDKVLMPGILLLSVYDALDSTGLYTTLINLLGTTGLASVIQTQTITLFAPPDSILNALPTGALDSYNVTEILLNHVVIGDPIPSDVFDTSDSYSLTTAAGNTYAVTKANNEYFIGGILISNEDNPQFNGIFHVLEGVLLPAISNSTAPPVVVVVGNATDPPMANTTDPPMGTNMTEPPVASGNLADVIAADSSLSTLMAAVNASGLGNALVFLELTVFAPTDDAFALVPQDLLSKFLLPEWGAHLRFLLANHLLDGSIFSTDLADGELLDTRLTTATGIDPVTATVSEAGVFLSGVAFTGSQVIEADIVASNGVIHKVDQVFMPTILLTSMYDIIAVDGFTKMQELIDSNGLDEIFKSETITAFGVPDRVFDALPAGAFDDYNITEVLLNHVILGVVPSTFLVDGFAFTTAAGNEYTVSIADSNLLIGPVQISFPDIAVSNGVIHIINSVLLPPFTNSSTTEVPSPMTPAPIAPVSSPTLSPPTATPGSAGASRSSSMVWAALLLLSSWSMLLQLL
jgi:transforming growth factor-beta-induced protein